MIYAAFILLIVAVVICHSIDWRINKYKGRVNHSRGLKWKMVFSIPAGILFTIYLTGWPVGVTLDTVLACGKSALLTGTWFLFLFNELWGYRAYHTFFARSTAVGKNISRWDRFVLPWPKWLYILFMVALVGAATILYFYAN